MRGNSHVRFGGRRRGNHRPQGRHGVSPPTPTPTARTPPRRHPRRTGPDAPQLPLTRGKTALDGKSPLRRGLAREIEATGTALTPREQPTRPPAWPQWGTFRLHKPV